MSTFVQMMTPIMDQLAAIMISHGIDPKSIGKGATDDQLDYWVKFGNLTLSCIATTDEDMISVFIIEDSQNHEINPVGSIELYPTGTTHKALRSDQLLQNARENSWSNILTQSLAKFDIGAFNKNIDDDEPEWVTQIDLMTAYMIVGHMAQAMVEYQATLKD